MRLWKEFKAGVVGEEEEVDSDDEGETEEDVRTAFRAYDKMTGDVLWSTNLP